LCERCDLALHLFGPPGDRLRDVPAGSLAPLVQGEYLLDLSQRQPDAAGVLYEPQPSLVLFSVGAVAGLGAPRLRPRSAPVASPWTRYGP
jgi:hypothetical protein